MAYMIVKSNPGHRLVRCPLRHTDLAKSVTILALISFHVTSLRSWLDRDKHGCFPWVNVFGTPQKPWLWTEKKQKALALLYLAPGPLPNATNQSDVPTEFAEIGSSVLVPIMSTLRIDWFRFFFCYSYGSQHFSLPSVSASQQNTAKMKFTKANFVTWTFRLPPILLNVFFPFIDINFFSQV